MARQSFTQSKFQEMELMACLEKPTCGGCLLVQVTPGNTFDGYCQHSQSNRTLVRLDEVCEHHQDWDDFVTAERSIQALQQFERTFREAL